jgi:dTDP-4-dehydrorhamnose 3,5-epimerase
MKFTEAPLAGAYVIELERHTDDRGWFARTFCRQEFEAHGLDPRIAQCSISYNEHAQTLRGMHYQAAPHEEAKLVRCVHGQIFDVIVDVRPGSPTRHRWFAVTLDAAVRNALYIPAGFAHGFLTLGPEAEVLYQISVGFAPDAARGLRWNDPALGIVWPAEPVVISAKDRAYPLLEEPSHA